LVSSECESEVVCVANQAPRASFPHSVKITSLWYFPTVLSKQHHSQRRTEPWVFW